MAQERKYRLHDNTKMMFGMHMGEKLGDIPDHYWVWFMGQSWRNEWPALVEYARSVDSPEEKEEEE